AEHEQQRCRTRAWLASGAGACTGGAGCCLAGRCGNRTSILIMIAASLLRGAWMFSHLVMPAPGPPWMISAGHVPARVVTVALWLGAAAGGGGGGAGLVAGRGGAQPSGRLVPPGG